MITGAGPISRPLAIIRNKLLNTQAWQDWHTLSGDDSDPETGVYIFDAPSTLADNSKLHAIVDWENNWSAELKTLNPASGNSWDWNGNTSIYVFAPITEDDRIDAALDFGNRVGALIAELLETPTAGNELVIAKMDLPVPPMRGTEDDENVLGKFFEVGISVIWGSIGQ